MSDTFTCQFCGEKLPSADTFHDLVSCYAHLKVRIDSLEAKNARLRAVDVEYRRRLAEIERMSRDTVESYLGNTCNTGEAWLMAQVIMIGKIARTALVEKKEMEA